MHLTEILCIRYQHVKQRNQIVRILVPVLVSHDTEYGDYEAYIKTNGKQTYLGRFETALQAAVDRWDWTVWPGRVINKECSLTI